MSVERHPPRPSRGGGARPSLVPAILVGAALGAVVGLGTLLVPMDQVTPPAPGAASTSSTSPAPGATSTSSSTSSASSEPAGESGPSGEGEADYLHRARALISTSPAEALALAEAYPRKYPGGKLGQERELVAIEALSALGRTDQARARARLFLTLFPGSAHRQRLEALIPDLAPAENAP